MPKYAPNALCLCGSGQKYKKCCGKLHKGALAKDALSLMRSRYCAYALGDSDYIIQTTHPHNPDFTLDTERWRSGIEAFCQGNQFLGLKILSFKEGEREAYVHFEAELSGGVLKEHSRFLKEGKHWLYVDGVFEDL